MLSAAIASTGLSHANEPGPCSFLAYEGILADHRVRVFVEEPESGSKLLGPACGNEIFVFDGSVLGIPDNEKWKEVRERGTATGLSYLGAVAALASARVERAAQCGDPVTVQVKMVKLPSDINLKMDDYAMRYLTDHKKKIDVRGPVFVTVRSELIE